MIKMHGTILELGTLDMGKLTFSKDCEITHPEKVPIKDGFEGWKEEVHDIGTGVISKDGDRFVMDAEIAYANTFSKSSYVVPCSIIFPISVATAGVSNFILLLSSFISNTSVNIICSVTLLHTFTIHLKIFPGLTCSVRIIFWFRHIFRTSVKIRTPNALYKSF